MAAYDSNRSGSDSLTIAKCCPPRSIGASRNIRGEASAVLGKVASFSSKMAPYWATPLFTPGSEQHTETQ